MNCKLHEDTPLVERQYKGRRRATYRQFNCPICTEARAKGITWRQLWVAEMRTRHDPN